MHIKNKRIELPCQVFVYYSPNAIIYTRRVFFLWCIVSAVNGRWDPARSVCIDESPLQPVDKINPPLQLATGSNNYRQQVVSGQLWSFMQYSKILRLERGIDQTWFIHTEAFLMKNFNDKLFEIILLMSFCIMMMTSLSHGFVLKIVSFHHCLIGIKYRLPSYSHLTCHARREKCKE